MPDPTTRSIEASGAEITYDVLAAAEAGDPRILLLIGSPMGAGGFGTLRGHFPDRTVVTYDPRGVERSPKAEPTTESTPEQHADDLHRVIAAAGGGPVDVFASSGGAVNALALVTAHPDDIATLVAHEPPLAQLVPDREAALAACVAVRDTYQRSGSGPAMARFIALVGHEGKIPDGYADQPGPDPAMFGMSSEDDGDRTDALAGQNIITCTHYQPDLEALRAAQTRIVVAVGAGSGQQLAARAGRVLAERLETEVVVFPGDHAGFLGGEYGQTGEPEAFAAKLREVLG